MSLNKTKRWMLLLAICFAVLQVLQPFIHAHLDEHTQSQHEGIHVGMEHEELLSSHDDVAQHPATSHAKHTISVDPGIKHDVVIATSAIPFVLFFICFSLLFKFVRERFPQFVLSHTKLLKRQPQSVRAPPLF